LLVNCNSYRYRVVKEQILAGAAFPQQENHNAFPLARSRSTRRCGDSRPEAPELFFPSCGDEGVRTPDLVVANHALSQLSYIPRLSDRLTSLRVLGFEPRTSALSELRSSQL